MARAPEASVLELSCLLGLNVQKNGAVIAIGDPVVGGVSDGVDHGNDGGGAKDGVNTLGSPSIGIEGRECRMMM